MELRFCIQDPTDTNTTYLYEAILSAAVNAVDWRGMYAFATCDGIDCLIEDKVVQELIKAGEINLLVGIDAVTNRFTLERLRDLERQHCKFSAKVFWNETSGLFHPKLSYFTYKDGRRTLIVGSGNLTPGGLNKNFEAYTVVMADELEDLDVSALDDFLLRHAAAIRSIDNEVLERAKRNLAHSIKMAQPPSTIAPPPPIEQRRTKSAQDLTTSTDFNRILIAEIPKAGGRWAQVHFNADIIEKYFRITDINMQRVYLTHVDKSGDRANIEVRPCVRSERNKNCKIEIRAAKNLEYPAPDDGRPILLVRERQLRTFDYMFFMPDTSGYKDVSGPLKTLPSIGKGVARVILTIEKLAELWPNCPLLTSGNNAEYDM